MDAYTLTTPRTKHHWSSGLTIICWMITAIPISAAASPPVLHSGSERYRISAPPATGRSGTATLSARALLGRGGETTVEVSTSTLDTAAPAPGNISRLQLKLLDDQGRVRGLENHNGLSSGGRLQLVMSGLGRGQPLQLQANIQGIDVPRTDVVTLQTRVRRRPDLAVQQLSAPESTSVATPVTIAALVGELGGDTGAEADCVLKVDGAEVDRAPGIWIDAASAVSCAFTYAFSSGGAHLLSVEITDVVPGDDDLSNNQATAIVQVLDGLRYHHEVSVDSASWRTDSRSEGWFTQIGGNTRRHSEWTNDYVNTGWRQSVQFRGELPVAVSSPLTAFELTHSSGGAAIPGTTFEELALNPSSACTWTADPVSMANLNLCTGSGRTSFTYTRYGGEVTYFSHLYQATWITDTRTGATSFSEWTTNSGDTTVSGATQWIAGDSYDFDVQVTDGASRYRATGSVPLAPYQSETRQPYTCTGSSSPGYTTETCKISVYTVRGVWGVYVSSAP